MHHRALRLLPSILSFSSILQAAAGRAWVRTSTSTAPTRPSPTLHDKAPKLSSQQHGSKRHKSLASSSHAPHRARPNRTRSVAYFNPEDVQDSDLRPSDHAHSYLHPLNTSERSQSTSERPWYWDDASIAGTSVGLHLSGSSTCPSPLVPLAKTPPSLYQNLLYLLSYHDPSPTLPALLDYHDLHPGLRSTRSYNLLISLALRNSSYGTVPWLLSSMRADSVPKDLETWKLRVRWLVQSGWWDKAWDEVMLTPPSTNISGKGEMKGGFPVRNALPLPIWLEFFRTLKRGTTRPHERIQRPLDIDQSTLESTPRLSEPMHLYLTRYHTLMNNRPTVVPRDLAQTPPKAVYSVVSTMLKVQHTDSALSLTRAYLTSLPPSISRSWARTCLDIIHLHIYMGSSHRGLRRLYETRRTMVSLISLHPTLRPTSTTLFLLLAPLRHAKRCGTVAWNTSRAFKAQWGAHTEDLRVRRRVATLATKEGRMDIVETMLRSERRSKRARGRWRSTQRAAAKAATPRPRRLIRPSTRKVFRRNGKEERHWCSLIKRVRMHGRRNKTQAT